MSFPTSRYVTCPSAGQKVDANDRWRDPFYTKKYKQIPPPPGSIGEGWRCKCPGCGNERAVNPRSSTIIKHTVHTSKIRSAKIRATKIRKVKTVNRPKPSVAPERIRQKSSFKREDRNYATAYNHAIAGSIMKIHGRTKIDGAAGRAWIMGTLDGFADAGKERELKNFVKYLEKEKGVKV